MKLLYLHLLAIILPASVFGQKEINYIKPPVIIGDGFNLEVDDIISTESVCKLQVILKNQQPDAFLVYNLQQSAFSFENMGKFYEKKQKFEVIPPLKKESFVVRTVGNDYRQSSFIFHPEGLWTASMQVEPLQPMSMTIKPGITNKIAKDGANINVISVTEKKGVIQVTLEFKLDELNNNQLLIIDPTQIRLLDENGNYVDLDFKRDKLIGLLAGESKKITFSYSSQQVVTTEWNKTFRLSTLQKLEVEDLNIHDKIKPNSLANENSCAPFLGQQNGSVNVNIQGNKDICFKLDINGFPVVTEFASASSIKLNPGKQRMVFIFPDGSTIEESTFINNWYSSIGYNIVKKKNGSYAIRYDVFAQVMSAEGERERNTMMTKITSSTSKSSNSTEKDNTNTAITSHENNTSSNFTKCFGEHTTGSTTVKIKITWKGNPVSNHAVRILQGGKTIGINSTDQNGIVNILTNNLSAPQIDVEGCSKNTKWSVSGSYCILDSSNYLELPLDVIARQIANLMGISLEEIGTSWGF